MNVGTAIALAGILVFLARTLIVSQVTASLVKTDSVRPAATAVIFDRDLDVQRDRWRVRHRRHPADRGSMVRRSGAARRQGSSRDRAPFLRDRPDWTFGIVAAIMALIFIWQPIPATGTPVGIIVFLTLAFLGTVLLRRQSAAEFRA